MKHLAVIICTLALFSGCTTTSNTSKSLYLSKPATASSKYQSITKSSSGTAIITIDNSSDTESSSYTVYGNWCGPNHPRDIHNAPAPIDQLDAACMKHDFCYAEKGYLDCDCDLTLNTGIQQNLNDGAFTITQTLVANSMHSYFSASPCNGDGKGKIESVREVQEVYNRIKNDVIDIINIVLPE